MKMLSQRSGAKITRLLTSTAIVSAAAGALVAVPAFAEGECGVATQGSVTCSATGNPYPNGITYTSPAVDPASDPGLDPTVPVYDLTVNLGEGVAIESGANPGVAIIGFNEGAATLNAFGDTSIAVSGTGAIGVIGSTNYGDLTINTDSIVADGRASQGINAVSNAGDITIDAGSIATTGNSSVGISANSYTGDIRIAADTVTAAGYYVGGIYAYAGNGDVTIDAGTVATTGGSFYDYGSDAITVRAGAGSVTIDAETVSTQADYSDGIRAVSFGPDALVDVTAGSITTNGYGAVGAVVQGSTAQLTVGDITTSGDGAYGAVMFGTGPGGATFVSDGSIETSGVDANGVFVKAYGGDATITVNDVSTTGDSAPAIYAYGTNTNVTVNGDVSTSGATSNGVTAVAIGGDLSVANNGSIATTGAGSAGMALAALGDVTVTGAGSVSASATGIDAYSAAGNIDITQGAIATTEAGADGVHAETANYYGTAGNITVDVGSVETAGDFADGIDATALNGGAIDITHGTVSTSGEQAFGVVAVGLEDVSITGESVTTSGYNAAGAYAVSIGGDVTVAQGTVRTAGDYAPGVVGASYFGNVTISADSVTTTGYSSNGVLGVALYGGDTNITVGDVSTSGDGSFGVNAQAYNAAAVTVTGTVTTSGYASDGVNVYAIGAITAEDNGGTVINNGAVVTSGAESDGIHVEAFYGDVSIGGTGSITTTGDFSTGIFARSQYGAIDIASASVASTGVGIDAYASGGVTVDAGTVRTTGDGSVAIAAGGFNSVAVTADAVSTRGTNATGISAASFGGDVTVDVGSVRVSGTDSRAIRALGFGGGADVTVGGAVRSTSGTAIEMIAGGAGGGGGDPMGDPARDGLARLTIAAGGSVQGGTNAITVTSLNGTTITNNGSITGGSGYAIQASGGAATIANNGALTGRLQLTDNADRLTNAGTLTLIGDSDFGAGVDVLNNSGTIRLGGAAATRTVAITNLETLSNSGLIDLRNGRTGDVLTLAGTAYTGTGDATLGLDLRFGTTTAAVDRLVVGSAGGSTSVTLQASDGQAILIPATTIVQTSAASSPTAFTLDPASRDIGLIQYGITYDPTALAYRLVSAPSATVYRQAKLGEGLASVWNRSGDAVTAHLAAGRDAGWGSPATDTTGRLWLQMFGEVNKRKESRDFAFNGLVQDDVNLGYRQDAFGGQIGFDIGGGSSENGGAVFGVSTGYLSSAMNFAGSGDRFDIDTLNGAIYGAFQAGGLFINGLAKYDRSWIEARGNFANFNVKTKANTWGGKLEAGARLGSDTFFAEPAVSIAYTKSDIDSYGTLGGRFDFDDFEGLRGKAGVKIGGATDIGESSKLVFYVGGAAVHEFKGDDGLRFTSGAQTLVLGSDALGTYGQGTLGFNIMTASGVTGFLEAHGEYGDDYQGGGGRAGIRIKF